VQKWFYILAPVPGGKVQGAATPAMGFMVKERQQRKCPPAAAL